MTFSNQVVPKRVLLATINYDHPQRGILHAFTGFFGASNVFDFDYLALERSGVSRGEINSRLIDCVTSFNPDWIFLQVQNTGVIEPETINRLRARSPDLVVTHWMGDARSDVGQYLSSICKACNITFVSNVGQIPMFLAAGAQRAEYMQVGLDWEEDVLGEPDWTPPFRVPSVVFVGNYYGSTFVNGSEDRVSAIRKLQHANVDVGVVGVGWPTDIRVVGTCHVKQQHHVWKRALVGLSISHFNDIDRYYSDRQFISMVSGTPVVCRYMPGLEFELDNGRHCLWFHNNDKMLDHVNLLLSEESMRKRIGAAGRAIAIRNGTWFARIQESLPWIVEERSKCHG